jgi:hypothetical protein
MLPRFKRAGDNIMAKRIRRSGMWSMKADRELIALSKRNLSKPSPITSGGRLSQFSRRRRDRAFRSSGSKSRHFRPILAFLGESGRTPDCLAGVAVVIAPVSTRFPWYQGTLQGILRFWGLETRFSTKKPLRCSHFSRNSLRRLSGKKFWGFGNLLAGIRELRKRLSVHERR